MESDAAHILLAMVVAAATGGDKSGVATRARQKLEEFRSPPGLVALSRRLERIIDGDRDTRLSADLDPLDSAIVTTVPTHIRWAEQSAPTRFPARLRELLRARPHADAASGRETHLNLMKERSVDPSEREVARWVSCAC